MSTVSTTPCVYFNHAMLGVRRCTVMDTNADDDLLLFDQVSADPKNGVYVVNAKHVATQRHLAHGKDPINPEVVGDQLEWSKVTPEGEHIPLGEGEKVSFK